MNVYYVEWVTNQGGQVSTLDEEVVAEDYIDAEEVVMGDYYWMSTNCVEYVREATNEEIMESKL